MDDQRVYVGNDRYLTRGSFAWKLHCVRSWAMDFAPLLVLAGLIIAIFALVGLGFYVESLGDLASGSAVRETVSGADFDKSEFVAAKVVEWNAKIADAQRCNRMPIIGWFVPDGWDSESLIPLPGK